MQLARVVILLLVPWTLSEAAAAERDHAPQVTVGAGVQWAGPPLAPPGPAFSIAAQGSVDVGFHAGGRLSVELLPILFSAEGVGLIPGAWIDLRGFAGGTRSLSPALRFRMQVEAGVPWVLPLACGGGEGGCCALTPGSTPWIPCSPPPPWSSTRAC